MNPFEYVNSILNGKQPIEDLSEYVSYLTNRSLSQHYDCIMQSNEMNSRSFLNSKMQYDFLYHSIRKYKRPFKKWNKEEKNDDIELLKEYFQYSTNKIKDILHLLSDEDIAYIKEKLQKGGITK